MSMLETERLRLRPFVMEDLDALHRIVSHPDVWQYDPGYERSWDETRALLVFRIGELQHHGIGRLAVTLKQTGALIVGSNSASWTIQRTRLPKLSSSMGWHASIGDRG